MLEYVQIYKWGWDQKKKLQKNPNLKRAPTIDEFGGYWKYENSDANLLALWAEDLNAKIALLDQECEKQYGPLPETTIPGKFSLKRRKTVDFENIDSNIQNQDLKDSLQGDNFIAPLKKVKRERYCSDVTNVTRSPALASSIQDLCSRAVFEDHTSHEKLEFCFDSGDMLDNDNSFCFSYSGNLFLPHNSQLA